MVMRDPYRTGISGITGTLASIRHATEQERAEIGEYVARHKGTCGLEGAEAVVAVEDDRMIAFGILQRKGPKPCVTIRELRRGKGLGTLIADHLMEYAGPEQ